MKREREPGKSWEVTWTWRGRQTRAGTLRVRVPGEEAGICPEGDGEPQKEPFLFSLSLKKFFWKMHSVGSSSPALILGSFYHFLEQKRAMRLPLEEKMSKRSVLQNEWSAILLGDSFPDHGSWESWQSCPITTKFSKVPSGTGNGQTIWYPRSEDSSNDSSKS